MEMILALKEVCKQYKSHLAVDRVSFEVPRGGIFGLLGPNGAGKTSLLRIITTITKADAGEVLFCGEPLGGKHPQSIGYMPEERGLYRKMKVGEQLLYLGRLKGLGKKEAKARIAYWLDHFEIGDWYEKRVEQLSKGMQQKVQFIATVMHKPDFLILDEPFSGLDPVNTRRIKDEIMHLNRAGTTVLFSTHRMEQVEQLCESIVLINKGQKVLDGQVRSIKNRYKSNRFSVEYDGAFDVSTLGRLNVLEVLPQRFTVELEEDNPNYLLRHVLDAGIEVRGFREILPSLDEIFIKIVDA